MENSTLLLLNDEELFECDGGGWVDKAVRVVEFLGLLDAAKSFTDGFAKGFSDAWK